MKTVQKNISLSEDLAGFASAEAEEGGYGSVSDYFADLLRQRRQAQIDEDISLLADVIKDAPRGVEPMDEIVRIQKNVRRQMRKEDWRPSLTRTCLPASFPFVPLVPFRG